MADLADADLVRLHNYAFGSPAPWLAADYWKTKIALPEALPLQ
jgi:hypothetical protein